MILTLSHMLGGTLTQRLMKNIKKNIGITAPWSTPGNNQIFISIVAY